MKTHCCKTVVLMASTIFLLLFVRLGEGRLQAGQYDASNAGMKCGEDCNEDKDDQPRICTVNSATFSILKKIPAIII